MLRRLEALLAVADSKDSLVITGNGDVIEPENGLIAIGSGGDFAKSAARALLEITPSSMPKAWCDTVLKLQPISAFIPITT